ncbi:MmpS family transport accessory protein [Actinomycetospora rhizophila]|uniref:MmpS family transport accessory protein n=1 Tax=Actinomycetospora rhizophila TaxID=1416876 RepID=A0ABV9Z8Y5_9PSEU
MALLLVIIAVSGGGSSQPTTPAAGQGQPSSAAPAASDASEAPSSDASSGGGTVVYEVTGSGRATNVTYSSNGSGGQSQRTNVRLPFRQEIPAEDFFGFYSVVAQNGQGGGTITCKITKDGEVIGEGESEGAFAVVTCNGS